MLHNPFRQAVDDVSSAGTSNITCHASDSDINSSKGDEIKQAIQLKRELYAKAQDSGDQEDWSAVRRQSALIGQLMGRKSRYRGNLRGRGGGRGGFRASSTAKSYSDTHLEEEKPPEFYCDSCERGFLSNDDLQTHFSEHVTCTFPRCRFTAMPQLVKLHVKMQHDTGYAEMMAQSPEDIAEYLAERRKRFPTLKRKLELEQQKKAQQERGEVLKSDNPLGRKPYYIERRLQSKPLSTPRLLNGCRNSSEVSNVADASSDVKPIAVLETDDYNNNGYSKEDPLVGHGSIDTNKACGSSTAAVDSHLAGDNVNVVNYTPSSAREHFIPPKSKLEEGAVRQSKRRKRGKRRPKQRIDDSRNSSHSNSNLSQTTPKNPGSEEANDTDLNCELYGGIPKFKGKTLSKPLIKVPFVSSIVSGNSEETSVSENGIHISDDEDNVMPVSCVSKNEEPLVCGALGNLIAAYGDSDDSDSEVAPVKKPHLSDEVPQNKHNDAVIERQASSSLGKETATSIHRREPEDLRQRIGSTSQRNSFIGSRRHPVKRPGLPRNQINRRRLTLLEKLLANDIRKERNKILQCVKFIVKNNFFDKSDKIEEDQLSNISTATDEVAPKLNSKETLAPEDPEEAASQESSANNHVSVISEETSSHATSEEGPVHTNIDAPAVLLNNCAA